MKDKEQRRAEAQERQEGYASLTAEQKIGRLDRLFGEGKGAVKVRAKIATALAAPKVTKKTKSKKKNEKTKEESA